MTWMRDCRRCGRRIRVSFWTWLVRDVAFCPARDFYGCFAVSRAMVEPPVEEEPEDPDLIPPHDIDVCSGCAGSGEVFVRRDWETGALVTETCGQCLGSGRVMCP